MVYMMTRNGISQMMIWHRQTDRNNHRGFPQRNYADPQSYGNIRISSKMNGQEESHTRFNGCGSVLHKIG